MDVDIQIRIRQLHNGPDRQAVFRAADDSDILPGEKSYKLWAGDGTEPTDWTEEEFQTAIRSICTENGWTVHAIADTRSMDLQRFNELKQKPKHR